MRSVFFCFALIFLMLPLNAFAEGEVSSPCYVSSISSDGKAFGTYEVKLENGEAVSLCEKNLKHTFVIVNGSFEDIPVFVEEGVSYGCAEPLCERLGLKCERLSDNSYNIEGMIARAKVKDRDLYIPLRYTAEHFGFAVSFTKEIIAPFYNSVIDIDNREKTFSESEAISTAVGLMKEGYNTLLSNTALTEKGAKGTEEDILSSIEATKCIGETAGFWILKGPYILLADKSSGEIFVKYGNGRAGHGSYSESILPLDPDNDHTFARDFYLG